MRALIALFLIAVCAAGTSIAADHNACFDDQLLTRLQHSGKRRGTLVYVWSPRMVYSAQNASAAFRAAAGAGLEFLALHDWRVPGDELRQTRWPGATHAAKRLPQSQAGDNQATPQFTRLLSNSRPLCASELIARDALRHFPTAFVITAQGIHPHAIVGAMPWSAWASSLDQRLSSP